MRTLAAAVLLLFTGQPCPGAGSAPAGRCDSTDGLVVPEGFCAEVVASGIGAVRQVAVAPNGDLFASIERGNGGVLLLRDADGDGRAETVRQVVNEGGTGIAYREDYLWLGANDRILRWPWTPGALEPAGPMETVVADLPAGGHGAKTFAFLPDDSLIVNFGSLTNSCQERDRAYRSPGQNPCLELETRAGLWLFSARRTGQTVSDGVRYATGLRNAMALDVEPMTGKLFAAPHGRDQLGQNWGFTDAQSAELPAEELVQAGWGDDFGWPYCYYDQEQGRKVLSPEYGGDGRKVGRCSKAKDPVLGFPGHWGPMALAFYTGTQFPAKYRGGAFVAFHGSWNRAPLPQAGYRVVFVPFKNGLPSDTYQTFATGAGPTDLRASGVTIGPDGSLYVVSDGRQTIWRVRYQDR